METDIDKLEKRFVKRMEISAAQLEDIYSAASDIEQERDLLDLYTRALRKKIIVPRVGFLADYDFDMDEYLSVTREGMLRFSKLTCKEDLDLAEICLNEEEKFEKLNEEVFFASLDEEEMKEFLDDGLYCIPVVEVMTLPDKQVPSDSDSSSESEEVESM